MSRQEEIERALSAPCIADNSLLSNFVKAGAADLLHALLESPVHLSPTVLDPYEASQSRPWSELQPTSELLKDWESTPWISRFACKQNELWLPVELQNTELTQANYFGSRAVRDDVRARFPTLERGRVQLDAGEAEAAAIAINRKWTLLVDDQAAVNLLRHLHPDIPTIRTGELLVYAAQIEEISCSEAAELFNTVIVGKLGFYAHRGGKTLRLCCDPPRCEWQ